jgi:rRNA maturation endonuclease Nob1
LIERRGVHYHYEPTAFVERYIQEREEQAETLANRMHRYATRLLYQCQQCNRIYINPRGECGLCGGGIMPVPRKEVMKSLNKERLRALVLAHRVKEKEE